MKVLFSPQLNENDSISYTFNGDIVTVTLNEVSDDFDFSSLPNGVLRGAKGEQVIETILPINPFGEVKRVDGILYLEVVNYIKSDASHSEKFPDWIDTNG